MCFVLRTDPVMPEVREVVPEEVPEAPGGGVGTEPVMPEVSKVPGSGVDRACRGWRTLPEGLVALEVQGLVRTVDSAPGDSSAAKQPAGRRGRSSSSSSSRRARVRARAVPGTRRP